MPINFTLVHSGKTNDESDTAGDVGEVAVTGELRFVAQLPEGQPALAPEQGATGASYWVRTFKGYLDTDGVLKNAPGGTPGVRIWANDPVLSLEQLPYLVYAPNGLRANGKRVELEPFVFNAPDSDIEVKFTEIQPVPSATAEGISRGLRGFDGPRGFSVDDVQSAGDHMAQFYVQGSPIGDPLPMQVVLDFDAIDGGTPTDPGTLSIDGGTP